MSDYDYRNRDEIAAAFGQIAEGMQRIADEYAKRFTELGEAVRQMHVRVSRGVGEKAP